MAAMTTVLTEFSDNGNSRTYSLSGHTFSKPKLVIQKRKVPSSETGVAEDSVKVVYGTEDSNGDLISSKIAMEVIIRRPANGISTDVDAALVVLRDIVAGDEFATMIDTQDYLS